MTVSHSGSARLLDCDQCPTRRHPRDIAISAKRRVILRVERRAVVSKDVAAVPLARLSRAGDKCIFYATPPAAGRCIADARHLLSIWQFRVRPLSSRFRLLALIYVHYAPLRLHMYAAEVTHVHSRRDIETAMCAQACMLPPATSGPRRTRRRRKPTRSATISPRRCGALADGCQDHPLPDRQCWHRCPELDLG